MDTNALTAKQYLKLHPDKYVIVTYEFGAAIYIAPLKDLQIQITLDKGEAELWNELDRSPEKLNFYIVSTGCKELVFEDILFSEAH